MPKYGLLEPPVYLTSSVAEVDIVSSTLSVTSTVVASVISVISVISAVVVTF